MKNLFVSAAVITASLFGMNAFAQSLVNPSKCETPKSECPYQKGECGKQQCDANAICFEGITLSDAQKTKIKALCEKRSTEAKQRKEAAKQRIEARDRKFKQGDSIRMAQKRQNLNEIKEILTPEQYVVYLENIVISTPSGKMVKDGHKGDMRHGKDRFDGRHHKNGHGHGDNRQPKQAPNK